MERSILNGTDYCAVIEDGRLAEYIQKDPESLSGDILLGKADRMMPGMDCAFVNIGRKKDGFLPLRENSQSFSGNEIRSGEMMILQVKKEERGEKGAFLTRDITIPGTYTLVMPMNRHIGISSRITDEQARTKLKRIGEEITDGRFGLVLRNAAAEADKHAIREEAEANFLTWTEIKARAAKGGKPGTVLFRCGILEQLMNDYQLSEDRIIQTGILEQPYRKQLKQAYERTVPLAGGGSIVIDRCEAFSAIDVNTASNAGKASKEMTVLETNLEACRTIAEQIRLRNLSGIIVIDFIDMGSEADRKLVSDRLEQCAAADRIKTVIHGWTSLGLLELTRKRTRPDIYEDTCCICSACGGSGIRMKEI